MDENTKIYSGVKNEVTPDYLVSVKPSDGNSYSLSSVFPNMKYPFMIGRPLCASHFNLGYSILADFLDMDFEDIPTDIVKNFTKCFITMNHKNILFPVFRFDIYSEQIQDWFFSVYPELFEDETEYTGEDIGDEVSVL